jgi:hypothetical protein
MENQGAVFGFFLLVAFLILLGVIVVGSIAAGITLLIVGHPLWGWIAIGIGALVAAITIYKASR